MMRISVPGNNSCSVSLTAMILIFCLSAVLGAAMHKTQEFAAGVRRLESSISSFREVQHASP